MDLLQKQIISEQLRTVYRQLPSIITAVAGAGIIFFIFKDIHPLVMLLSWSGIIFINCIFAVMLYLYFIKHEHSDLAAPHYRKLYLLFTTFTGIVWGSIGVIFYSAPAEYKLFIVVWLWAMGAGMSALLISYKPAFYSMIVPLLAPLVFSLAMDKSSFYHALSVATFLWMISLIYFYHGNHKTFLQAISLRFLNEKLMEDLEIKNNEAENANLAKSQFLAAASHDLRQPLHAQSLFLAELDQYIDDPVARRVFGGLESSVYSMRKLLNAILDISKLDAGIIVPVKDAFPVSAIFESLKSEFEPVAVEKGICLRVRECKLILNTDPVLLERILRNIVANAIRYTHKGKVLVGCRWHCHSVNIQVLDTGTGIPEDKYQAIFMPFVQLGNPERDREKGLGLGLSIVQRTADLLDHELSLKSTQNRGTSVSIEVPLSNQMVKESAKHLSGISMESITDKHIIIIDDDAGVRTSMQGLLKSWGCLPVVFKNMQDALSYAKQNVGTIDLILSDLNLPDNASGIQAIEALRSYYGAAIPAVLITGDTTIEQLCKANASGYQVIHKPVLASELLALISRLVASMREIEVSGKDA